MFNDNVLKNKSILVTGGGTGLGKEMATHVASLGAKIYIKNNKAFIHGNTKFVAAELMSSDLRASVALVLAAIVSNGKSYINRIYHLDRGYEKIENKLRKIGVKIKRIK